MSDAPGARRAATVPPGGAVHRPAPALDRVPSSDRCARVPPPSPIWYCTQDLIVCRYQHKYRPRRERGASVRTRVDGHVYYECTECCPSTYAFGVAHAVPRPTLTFYACTRTQWDGLFLLPDTADTIEILRFLQYVPALP